MNKNEHEWWNNPNTPLWLLPPHCIFVEGRTRDGLVFVGQAHRLGDLIAEERKRVLASVREIVKRAHVKADAKEPKERIDLAVRILTRLQDEILDSLDSLSKKV